MQKNLLIIHQGALGDIVSIFPAITRLREQFANIDILCKQSVGQLISHLKLTDRQYPSESALFSSLFSGKPDPRFVEIISSYDEIILFSYSEELEKNINIFFKNKIHRLNPRPDADLEVHALNYLLANLDRIGLISGPRPPEADCCPTSPEAVKNQRDNSRIFIHPGSGSKRKNWKLSNFINLFVILKAYGMNPKIITGPAEDDIAGLISDSLPSGSEITAFYNLPVLSETISRCGGFIGNDSGISHLAAYTGVPTVVIFGPSSPVRWKPFGRLVEIVRHKTDCSPCFETEKSNCADVGCLEQTTPEIVAGAIIKMMNG